MPSRPRRPSSGASSRGSVPASNHAAISGRRRSPTQRRTVSRMSRSSSLNSVSSARTSRGSGGAAPEAIDDVQLGCTNGAGEDNRNVARMAALLAGLPHSVPGATVNRLCASGGEALVQAARAIAVGDASVMIAGGVESMSRAPYVLPKPDEALPRTMQLHQTQVGWRLVNPKFPDRWTRSLGACAEAVAAELGIGRQEQDEWSLRSHQLAAEAWQKKL